MTRGAEASLASAPAIDMGEAMAFLTRLTDGMASAMAILACGLGDRLGLFKELVAGGPVTSVELAARTGLDERYIREWLHCLASAGYIRVDPAEERFSLPPEHAVVLAFEESPFCVAGAFQLLPALAAALEVRSQPAPPARLRRVPQGGRE